MFRAFVLTLIAAAPWSICAQSLKITGTVVDARTDKAVANASVSIREQAYRDRVVQANTDGRFTISLSGNKSTLLVKSGGYLPLHLIINPAGRLSEMDFILPVLLVPVEKQALDKPYLQGEQTRYTLDNAPTRGNAVRIFEIRDAVTGKPVAATLCLFYTNAAKKVCLEAGKSGLKVAFTQADIIALEVQKPGYQPYKGNLILNELDQKTSTYQIWLSPLINMISVTATKYLPECYQEGSRTNLFQSRDGMHYWAYIKPGAVYKLLGTGRDSGKGFDKIFTASEGISFYALDGKDQKPAGSPSLTPTAYLADTSKKTVLYFNQSEYKLRPENLQILDSLARLLRMDSTVSARIGGFTDHVGPAHLNETLAAYRARVTFHYLVSKGADPKRLRSYGQYPTTKPSPKASESEKAKDRKVEIQFTRKADKLPATKNG